MRTAVHDVRFTDVAEHEVDLRLLAAILAQAVEDARNGDVATRRWLIEEAPAVLSWLVPEHADECVLHDKLIARAQPAERPWFRRIEKGKAV